MELVMSCACAGLSAAFLVLSALRWCERKRLWRTLGLANNERAFLFERWLVEGGAGRLRSFSLAAAAFASLWSLAVLPGPAFVRLIAGGIAGYAAPFLWLKAKARRRAEMIELCLPGFLDWLALSVEAGESFAQALSRIAESMALGPLKEELSRLNADMRVGIARREALSSMARRAGSDELRAIVTLIVQADIMGASVGPVLRASSGRLRARRLASAERRGVAAAQKALVPLVLCIMPATFVVVFGPLIARLATGGIAALF